MNFFKVTIGIGLLFFIVTGQWACSEPITDYKREKVFLDSIENRLTSIELSLNIDEKELETRIATINTWYIKLSDTTYDVAKKMQVDFNGFKIVYGKYIENFFTYSTAASLHKDSFKQLKDDVEKQTLTREEFKTRYTILKKEVDATYDNVKSIAQPVYDLELSWKRYYKTMNSWK